MLVTHRSNVQGEQGTYDVDQLIVGTGDNEVRITEASDGTVVITMPRRSVSVRPVTSHTVEIAPCARVGGKG